MWGPKDTIYEGGYFHLDIKVNLGSKHKIIQKIICLTKIWHPNISSTDG